MMVEFNRTRHCIFAVVLMVVAFGLMPPPVRAGTVEVHLPAPAFPSQPTARRYTARWYRERGESRIMLKQYRLAERDLKRAVRKAPRDWKAYRSLAFALAHQRKYRESLRVAERGLAISPTTPLMTAKVDALTHLRRHSEAIRFATRSIRKNPKSGELYYFRARAKEASRRYSKRSVNADYRRATRLFETDMD